MAEGFEHYIGNQLRTFRRAWNGNKIFLPLGPETSGNRAAFGRDAKLHVAFDEDNHETLYISFHFFQAVRGKLSVGNQIPLLVIATAHPPSSNIH